MVSYSFTDKTSNDYITKINKCTKFSKSMDEVWILSKCVYINNVEKKIRVIFVNFNGDENITFYPDK
jgi:hypothetical protein